MFVKTKHFLTTIIVIVSRLMSMYLVTWFAQAMLGHGRLVPGARVLSAPILPTGMRKRNNVWRQETFVFPYLGERAVRTSSHPSLSYAPSRSSFAAALLLKLSKIILSYCSVLSKVHNVPTSLCSNWNLEYSLRGIWWMVMSKCKSIGQK